MKLKSFLITGLVCLATIVGAETMPPAPAHYFNDYAGVITAEDGKLIDNKLSQFDQSTSNQIVVAIFPTLDTESSMEDYTQRVAHSWQVGQAKLNNGAVLFVFVKGRSAGQTSFRIETGYGLEGVLPDGTCHRIIYDDIIPHVKLAKYKGGGSTEWARGINAGIDSMFQASRGEYTRAQVATATISGHSLLFWIVVILIVLIILIFIAAAVGGFDGGDEGYSGGGGYYGGGSSDSSSSSSGGDSGGFSGGGGDFGGGGASGDC